MNGDPGMNGPGVPRGTGNEPGMDDTASTGGHPARGENPAGPQTSGRTGPTDPTESLARRYRALMLAYPKAWRTARGDEMLGTLLDAAEPGRHWPSARQAASIALQGSKERLDLRRRRTPGEVWSEGLRIGALILLCQAFAAAAVAMLDVTLYGEPSRESFVWPAVAGALGIVAMAALVAGRTVVAAVATALWCAVPVGPGVSWQLVTALVILAGTSGRGRRRVTAVWLAAAPLVVALWLGHHLLTGVFIEPPHLLLLPVALLLAATVGVLADPRLPIAAACLTVAVMLSTVLRLPIPLPAGSPDAPSARSAPAALVLAAIAVVLLTIGHLRARRLARI